MPESAGTNKSYPNKTDQYIKRGQTSGKYGNDPMVGSVNKNPKELNV